MSLYCEKTRIPFITSSECGLSDWFKGRGIPHIVVPLGPTYDITQVSKKCVEDYLGGNSDYKYFAYDGGNILASKKLIIRRFDNYYFSTDVIEVIPLAEGSIKYTYGGVMMVRTEPEMVVHHGEKQVKGILAVDDCNNFLVLDWYSSTFVNDNIKCPSSVLYSPIDVRILNGY